MPNENTHRHRRHHRRPTDPVDLWRSYLAFRRRTKVRRVLFAIIEFSLGVLIFYKFIAPKIYG